MTLASLNFGIPNIDLARSCGGTVNPSHLVGHQIVILFLPTDAHDQSVELEEYQKRAADLTNADGWLLVVDSKPRTSGRDEMPIEFDSNGELWEALTKVAKADNLDRSRGAAFQFTRGGAVHRFWPGPGHASEVLEELRSRR